MGRYIGGHETSRKSGCIGDSPRKAVELLQQEMTVAAAAAAVKASTSSVKRWRDAYEQGGDEGLNSTPHPGPRPRLSKKQQELLTKILLRGAEPAGTPTTCGPAHDCWR